MSPKLKLKSGSVSRNRRTVPEIVAVLGHKTSKMALFYVQQVQQEGMNENAVAKWDAAIEKRAARKVASKRAALVVVA